MCERNVQLLKSQSACVLIGANEVIRKLTKCTEITVLQAFALCLTLRFFYFLMFLMTKNLNFASLDLPLNSLRCCKNVTFC